MKGLIVNVDSEMVKCVLRGSRVTHKEQAERKRKKDTVSPMKVTKAVNKFTVLVKGRAKSV